MSSDGAPSHDFDVALSYASEDRYYVQQVAEGLRDAGVRVFYDEFAAVELWGADLYAYLDDVYRHRARFTIVFISASYAAKEWTAHERQSAQARAMNELGPYLLPVKLDSVDLPGLRPTVSYLDASKIRPPELVEFIQAKIEGGRPAGKNGKSEVQLKSFPRTALQRQRLINERPVGWEYILWGSVMWSGFEELEPKWFDHELRTATRAGLTYHPDQVHAFLQEQFFGRLQVQVRMLGSLLDSDRQQWAVGLAGASGEPTKIEHFAKKFVSSYEALMDWAAEIRGAHVPETWKAYVGKTASAADSILLSLRDFVADFALKCTSMPEHVGRGEPFEFHLTLKLTFGEGVTESIMDEYERLVAST